MRELRIVQFVARHTVELQGLRTALLGGLCLTNAAWCVAWAAWSGTAVSPQVGAWIPLLLLGWHVDDRLVVYYRARIGHVFPQRQGRRLVGLLTITLSYLALRGLESQVESAVAVSALFMAGVQLHIGLISGEPYRRHYLLGAACWAGLSLVPLLAFSPESRSVLWVAAMGFSLTWLGWRDHVLLVQSLANTGESVDVEDV